MLTIYICHLYESPWTGLLSDNSDIFCIISYLPTRACLVRFIEVPLRYRQFKTQIFLAHNVLDSCLGLLMAHLTEGAAEKSSSPVLSSVRGADLKSPHFVGKRRKRGEKPKSEALCPMRDSIEVKQWES